MNFSNNDVIQNIYLEGGKMVCKEFEIDIVTLPYIDDQFC